MEAQVKFKINPSNEFPVVMTIAGSDASGGAGIQADLKTFTSLRCYGTSVITALTAQNTMGVQNVHLIPPSFVEEQFTSVTSDIRVQAIKTGMLTDAGVTAAVAGALRTAYASSAVPSLVCDPVTVSTSGHVLLQPDAVDVMMRELFPLAHVITPNKPEAELLLSRMSGHSRTIESLEDMIVAAEELLSLGPHAVLVKGGHLSATPADILLVMQGERDPADLHLVVDVLQEAGGARTLFLRPKLDSTSTHGTGCTLSAALACFLARGFSTRESVKQASIYTHQGIAAAFLVGHGHGPLNHMHPILHRCIPTMLIETNASVWKQYVEHDFVKQLGSGTLPKECFVHFIKQDYLYLKYYSRAYALLAAKSPDYVAIRASAEIMLHVVRESTMHRSYCEKWGVTPEQLDSTAESAACTAYGAYIMDMGLQGDSSHLTMALAACLLGYGEVGLWLQREALKPNTWVKLEGNPYRKWIDDYSGEEYQDAVKKGVERIEALAAADPPSPKRFEEWRLVWEKCTQLEKQFWDMGLNLS
ncbi:hypothetical protein HETIRDRAFT_470181 [Heterobasidion irregulare TC 32-1]|uniref:Uncharacterized protein n=1 Tax=Heterobasidion irregulare (strain TC 32-1) TaxID=747525 RepID=W4KH05_HETIT|nr:uncharacterized protein HETIRDRAFT_470181 [Heterobasidion irregulare TC 32-1]ETW85143.1 hypothetical protein HETIRDRAFT_470181 [Heterobasidion irregulare TC 32-1]